MVDLLVRGVLKHLLGKLKLQLIELDNVRFIVKNEAKLRENGLENELTFKGMLITRWLSTDCTNVSIDIDEIVYKLRKLELNFDGIKPIVAFFYFDICVFLITGVWKADKKGNVANSIIPFQIDFKDFVTPADVDIALAKFEKWLETVL